MKTLITLLLLSLTAKCFALEIEAKMLAQGSAVLQIDGKQRMLRSGARSPEGVLLVAADTKQAVIEFEGKRKSLSMSRQISTQFKAADKTEIRIASGAGQHYRTKGLVNGKTVDFIVDTGATTIAMNHFEAERLNIDYRAGKPVTMSTANGDTEGLVVTLASVSVGNIVAHQVQAVVSTNASPSEILLGNTYLSKVDLKIDQGVLVLTEK